MTRPLRLHVPGMLHHIVARGNEKQCIFIDDEDYRCFLELLQSTLERFAVRCGTYCLLWNHYHLLAAPGEEPLSRMMQQLNSSYCQRFNRRHGRVGHVLQGRFGSKVIEDGAYARSAFRYVALNPVVAGRCSDPGDWQWSGYRAIIGRDPCPDFLNLELVCAAFGACDVSVMRQRFTDFVLAGLQEDFPHPLLYGSWKLQERVAPLIEPHAADREFVYPERFATRPGVHELFLRAETLRHKREAAYIAFQDHGYTLEEIGRFTGRTPSTIWRWVQRTRWARLSGAPRSSRDESDEEECPP